MVTLNNVLNLFIFLLWKWTFDKSNFFDTKKIYRIFLKMKIYHVPFVMKVVLIT
jgi:hypothetical protein